MGLKQLLPLALTGGMIATLVINASASQRAAGPSLEQLVERATTYVEEFISAFSRVVAEEEYVQDRLEVRLEGSRGSFLGTPQKTETRTLRSDLLLVLPPGAREWLILRDVFEVDGRPVRDRDDRLAKLFLQGSATPAAIDRAQEISAEGNRFHFREVGTYDNPLFALAVLQREYRPRFRFTLNGRDRVIGPNSSIVEFSETGRPSVIRGPNGTNVTVRGRYWIDADTGRVIQTELSVVSLNVQSLVTTSFAFDEQLRAFVPAGMRVRFRRGVNAGEIQGRARYSRFRRFEVRTEERLQQ